MTKRSHMTLFPLLLVLYEVAIYLSMDAYVPALPKITTFFAISANLAQLTMVIWMIGGLAVQLIFGPLSDRYGRRPLLLWGGVLYILSSVLCAVAPTIHVLLIGRFLQGVAMPSMFIAGYAAINELFDSKQAIGMLARMNSVTILAPAFGPLLGGAFLLAFSWRWIFIILGLWALITVVLLYFKMPETVVKPKPFQFNQIILHYRSVFANYKFILLSLLTVFPIIGVISWILAGPFIIIHKFHLSTLTFGIIQTFIFGSFILGTKVVSKFATADRNHFLINLGLGLAFLGAIITTLISWLFPNALFAVIAFIMLLTFGGGLSMPILSRLTLEASDAPMGIRVTVFSLMRIGSGVLGSVSVLLFYSGSLISLAAIMLFFTAIAVVIRILLSR